MTRVRSVRARRRSKPSLLARMRMMWLVLFVAGAVVGTLAYLTMLWPGFDARVAGIEGAHHVSAHEIAQAAALDEQRNLWLQSKRKAELRIEALPYVKRASIHRSLPGRVRIVVSERVPAALVALDDGSLALIDGEARILQRGMPRSAHFVVIENVRAPIAAAGTFITDPTIGRLMGDAKTLTAAGVAVRSIGLEQFGAVTILTRAGLRVRFGADADLPEKIRLIDPILRTVGARLGKVAALDLRSPKTPIVVYR